MAYNELIKNFEKIRAYMREFYVYGFKSRTEFDQKSARSYDDERRRIESWLGDYMGFVKTPEGKNVFLSIDSRSTRHNPLYKAWKAKSFTDGDITLHFLLMDILSTPEISLTLTEIVEEVDEYLYSAEAAMAFDESTIRKKLKEYTQVGIVCMKKEGRRVLYSRAEDTDISRLGEVLDYFSEAAPCGVVGSYLRDRLEERESFFSFKHHYITQTMDSDVLAELFDAMGKKTFVTVNNHSPKAPEPVQLRLVPLKIYISAQNGRYNLLAWHEKSNLLNAYRLDYLSDVKRAEVCPQFDELRRALERSEAHMWGVNGRWSTKKLEHVEFDVRVGEDEPHIVQRLDREKRCGTVERVEEGIYRYSADVFDTREMLPWIRTFLCRITRLRFSNRTVENLLREDLKRMYQMYGIEGGQEL